eukprot:scaffold10054_cov133-Isochrysis_galbana.AAC.3
MCEPTLLIFTASQPAGAEHTSCGDFTGHGSSSTIVWFGLGRSERFPLGSRPVPRQRSDANMRRHGWRMITNHEQRGLLTVAPSCVRILQRSTLLSALFKQTNEPQTQRASAQKRDECVAVQYHYCASASRVAARSSSWPVHFSASMAIMNQALAWLLTLRPHARLQSAVVDTISLRLYDARVQAVMCESPCVH